MSNSIRFFKKKPQFEDTSKILLDSSSITNMKAYNKTSHHVSNMLGSRANLYTTSCNASESGYPHDVKRIKDLNIRVIGCDHKGRLTGNECLLNVVDSGNKGGYFVGTAQEDFVPDLQQLSWVPVIQVSGSQMSLRRPSKEQIQIADDEENALGNAQGGRAVPRGGNGGGRGGNGRGRGGNGRGRGGNGGNGGGRGGGMGGHGGGRGRRRGGG